MKKILLTVVGTVLTHSALTTVHADTFNLNQSGTWSDASTWTKISGSGSETVPEASDSVSISNVGSSRLLTLDASTTIEKFDYNDTAMVSIVGGGSGTKVLTVDGDFTKAGTGTLRITNGSGINTRLAIGGNLVVNDGTLALGISGTAANLLTVSGSTIVNGGSLSFRMSGGTSSGNPIRLGAVSVATGGTIRLQINSGSPFGPQFFALSSLSGGGDITAEVVASYSATVTVDMANDSDFSGRFLQTGAGSVINLVKNGSATLTLSGSSDYTGTTSIIDGAISVASIGSASEHGNLGTTGTINLGSGASKGRLIYTGAGEVTGRQFGLSGAAGGVIEANGTGALVLTESINMTTTGAKTLELSGTSPVENKIFGVIADYNGANKTSLSKTGAGTWVLAGENTYTGNTTVSQGLLVAENNAAFGGSEVTVSGSGKVLVKGGHTVNTSLIIDGGELQVNGGVGGGSASVGFGATGGRLSGSGTMNVAVALNHVNQVLAPGDGIGKMTLGNDQAWTAFTYDWKLDSWNDDAGLAGDAYSQIIVDGGVDLNGASQIVLSLNTFLGDGSSGQLVDFSESDRTWVILTADSLNSFNSAIWTINTDGFQNAFTGNWIIGSDNGNILLTYQAVPEPKTCLLLIGGAGLLLYRRFRN